MQDERTPLPDDDVAAIEPDAGLSVDMQVNVARAADLLRAIGSEHRLMILCLLSERDMTVSEVCEATGMRQSLASQHLGRLRLDELVRAERKGHFVVYSLCDAVAREIVQLLHRHFCAPKVGSST